jgi:hypothetical protein
MVKKGICYGQCMLMFAEEYHVMSGYQSDWDFHTRVTSARLTPSCDTQHYIIYFFNSLNV